MSFWQVLTITFILGLGGAISPGTLLTYTIFKSLKAKRWKAFLVGLYISLGHAIIEITIILILIAGLAPIISQPIVLLFIGLIGGGLLTFFGGQILLDIKNNKIDTSFLNKKNLINVNAEIQKSPEFSNLKRSKLYDVHPILGGIFFLMANPYWWLWWVTVGLSIMLQNSVSFSNMEIFWGFMIGKQLGQMLWYTFIATAIGYSSKFMKRKVYIGVLLVCSLFMIGYGFYLVFSAIITPILA